MLWVAGIIMSLAGSLLSNLGLLVQKAAYNKGEEEIMEDLEATREGMQSMASPALRAAAKEVGVPEKDIAVRLKNRWTFSLKNALGFALKNDDLCTKTGAAHGREARGPGSGTI